MPRSDKQNIVKAILDRTPESLAGELSIDVVHNRPAPLFQWLIASLLFSARISADIAQRAAKALFAEGWRTPQKMAATNWKERVTILNRSGYARYDESTSRYIGTSTQLLLDTYNGDLRRLRDAANRDPETERQLIKQFKGIGDVGCDIFFREVQLVWDELYPFADRKALDATDKLGLGTDAGHVAGLVARADLPRLLTGLVRLRGE
ncbi:MAG TPA: hypothetical protein VK862_13670 [Afifellaceae bacterium]|nr:hypothetical protein [Afifellaceae bacterium]